MDRQTLERMARKTKEAQFPRMNRVNRLDPEMAAVIEELFDENHVLFGVFSAAQVLLSKYPNHPDFLYLKRTIEDMVEFSQKRNKSEKTS